MRTITFPFRTSKVKFKRKFILLIKVFYVNLKEYEKHITKLNLKNLKFQNDKLCPHLSFYSYNNPVLNICNEPRSLSDRGPTGSERRTYLG